MTTAEAFQNIRTAIDAAPRNGYVAELHLQVIKYADLLKDLSGKEFCAGVGIGESFGTEFLKMRKIADRLVAANLDVAKI
ncbi:transcription factor (plasmid) [Neorhizobium sp. SOG26]|uniref:HTH-like domain-containing protein n=1 Tax=Neorhizobium sp. SOG26 TaxID=2060726 RepID=UPI000E579BA4|nr:transcription factor [Neorhizobium sp. SOG26]AXV18545.1 transcription factor [Neorhizobium sp. SOG26]